MIDVNVLIVIMKYMNVEWDDRYFESARVLQMTNLSKDCEDFLSGKAIGPILAATSCRFKVC